MIKLNQLIYGKEFSPEMTQRLLFAAGASDWLEQFLNIIKELDEDRDVNGGYEIYKGQIEDFLHCMEEEYHKAIEVNEVYLKLTNVEKIQFFITYINGTIDDLNDKIKAIKNRSFKVVHNGVVLPKAEVIFEFEEEE